MMGRCSDDGARESIREDLRKLEEWAEKWQMAFNVEKCKVMHVGAKNSEAKYEIGGREMKVVKEEKDLGVLISQDMKVSRQCGQAAKKANMVLGMISRAFVSRSKTIMVKLYKALVRPHLDYCVQAWRPYLKKDIEILERVQRRMTRMIGRCGGLKYEQRLERVGLTTLETRRLRADLVETYKIFKGKVEMDEKIFFDRHWANNSGMDSRRLRGNSYKIKKKGVRLDVAKWNFGRRVVNEWNKLPDGMVQEENLDEFKGRLDRYFRNTRGLI